ncbi:hypothetical protein LCGC14_2381800 [marine sediment metagenome]|uniref:Uncharacterized protein n=1 Tax=marine sediment metagenome TaxID=412755 RepID=A0A0F9EVH2_9ZZZZ
MPHIKDQYRKFCGVTLTHPAADPGVLNYQFTLVLLAYLRHNGLTYGTCNDIVGALDNCKDEFRRLVQHPYEDEKIKENGSAYKEEVI